MAGRAQLRASDQDRDRVAERLRNAAAEGRLATHELEQRVESALRARTYGQLEWLIEDLPGASLTREPRRRVATLTRQLVALAIVLAALAVVTAVVVAVLAGLAAAWWLWFVAAWLLFGRRRGRHAQRHCRGSLPRREARLRDGHWA
jgi:Flp pilus assembly protein TadB